MSSMSDAAARREARRRRILENGDSRLQKITGQIGSERPPDEIPKRVGKLEPSVSHLSRGFSETPVIDSWNVSSDLPSELPAISSEVLSPKHQNVHKRKNLADGETQRHENELASEKISAHFQYPKINKTSLESKVKEGSSFTSFLKSRWVYSALAIIVNTMIVLKMEYLFATSILVPFLLILTSRVILCSSRQESQSGSMLFAALILCNIRPEIINRLKSISGFTMKLLSEFFFYLFNFILIFHLFTSHWRDFDELIPNKAESILNRQTEL